MKNNVNKEDRPVLYIRLLSYANACKVIDFIKEHDPKDYAHITPGGVTTQVSVSNWDKVIDFIESLGVRYEIGKEHPEVVNNKIIDDLKRNNVVQVAIGGYTDPQAKEIIRRRHEIVVAYCKKMGWDPDSSKLEIRQVMEIRAQQEWKEVPQKVKEEMKAV